MISIFNPTVTVLIVTYNSRYWIENNAADYLKYDHLTFVDNASSDDTVATIRKILPHANIIQNEKNLGFGSACNQGMQAVNTPYILFLNPDCTCDVNQINCLIESAKRQSEAAIVAPQVLTKHNQLEISYRMGLFKWQAKQQAPAEGLLCVEFVTGACMLVDVAKMKAVNGFNEQFFLYYEDEDFCLRLRKQGYSILIEPKATVQHFARSGSKNKLFQQVRTEYIRGKSHTESKILFYTIHGNNHNLHKLKIKLLLGAIFSLPFRLLQSVLAPKYLARVLGRIAALM